MTKLALIGKGRWGKNYLSETEKIDSCEIKYIKTHDYKDLLNYKDIDGIIIATPARTHAEIIKTFPNKYLLVEKPLTINLEDALAIKNKNIMVGYTYLFNVSVIQGIKDAGTINQFNFTLHNTNSYGSKVGPIWELAPHAVSLFTKITKTPINIRSAKLKSGNLTAVLESKNCTCEISVGWDYTEKERDITFVGKKKTIKFDGTEVNKISPLQNEIRSFINFIQKGKNISTLKDGIKVVELLAKIEKACTI